jgi:hypothetical protein
MLRLSVNGQEAGATIKLPQAGAVQLAGEVRAQFPLEKLEIVVNGQVAATTAATGDRLRILLNQDLPIERSGWIALRARGQRGPGQQAAEAFAHTSAVYVEVAGRPTVSAADADAEYFIRWIQRLRDDVRGRDRIPAQQQAHVESQLSQAIEFYRRMQSSGP